MEARRGTRSTDHSPVATEYASVDAVDPTIDTVATDDTSDDPARSNDTSVLRRRDSTSTRARFQLTTTRFPEGSTAPERCESAVVEAESKSKKVGKRRAGFTPALLPKPFDA